VQNLPDGPARNGIIQNIGFLLLQSDPASAMQLVSTISDVNVRNSIQQNLASNWMQIDPTTAIQWVNNSSLPAQFKKIILQQKQSTPGITDGGEE